MPNCNCLACGSSNLISRPLNGWTNQYLCQDCDFVFDDNDKWSLSGLAKATAHLDKPTTVIRRNDDAQAGGAS